MLELATTLSGERALISQMIYVAIATTGLKRIAEFTTGANLSEEDLTTVHEAMLRFQHKRIDLRLAFEAEYFGFLMLVSDMLEGEKSLGYMAMGKPAKPGFLESLAMSKFAYGYSKDVDIFRRWRGIYQEMRPVEYYEQAEVRDSARALEDELRGLGWRTAMLAQIAMPSLYESCKAVAENENMSRGAVVLVAIRLYEARNGSLPDSLDDLGDLVPKEIIIDPFSGKSLIYRCEGEDFYLYSTGYNGVDDKCKGSKLIFEDGVDRESVPDHVFHAPPSPGK